jgi:putative DNA primase/helicase
MSAEKADEMADVLDLDALRGSDRFFTKEGSLRVATLGDAIRSRVTLGRLAIRRDLDDDDVLWHYEGGVWRPDGARAVERAVNKLLGEQLRQGHVSNVKLHLRTGELDHELSDEAPHPELLNFRNTMLEWETGKEIEHDPSFGSTVQLGTDWNPEAVCPHYDAWLRQVVPEDCVEWVDEITGYLMLNGNPLHKAIMLTGSGRNGKGTFLRAVTKLIGKHNCATVTLQSMSENRFTPAELYMKLADIAGELDASYIESTAMFKMVTGQDTIPAERKFGRPFGFTAWAVPIFSANEVPTSSDTSEGYMSRWEVIPFPVWLPGLPGGIDDSVEGRIAAELPGIAVRGARGLWRLMNRGRFERPPSVVEAFEQFERDVNPIKAWLADECEQDAGLPWVYRTDLYNNYRVWAPNHGHRPISATKFYKRVEQAGVQPEQHPTTRLRGFVGIKLRLGMRPL